MVQMTQRITAESTVLSFKMYDDALWILSVMKRERLRFKIRILFSNLAVHIKTTNICFCSAVSHQLNNLYANDRLKNHNHFLFFVKEEEVVFVKT